MRLLVTRPAEQAAASEAKLRALGHSAVLAPVLEIVATGAPPPRGGFDLVLATSAQAFAGVAPSDALTALPFVCVGEKTAAAARAAGFAPLHVASRAQALAAWLLAGKSPGTALYLAGRERKPDLEALLGAAGWRVEIVETYAAQPVRDWPVKVRAALAAGAIDGVLHYSPRSAGLALALIGAAVAPRLRHYCLSPEVAEVCAKWAPPGQIFVAFQPDEESLITLLHARDARSGEQDR
jgi:uroporphyrinogen-III synthase